MLRIPSLRQKLLLLLLHHLLLLLLLLYLHARNLAFGCLRNNRQSTWSSLRGRDWHYDCTIFFSCYLLSACCALLRSWLLRVWSILFGSTTFSLCRSRTCVVELLFARARCRHWQNLVWIFADLRSISLTLFLLVHHRILLQTLIWSISMRFRANMAVRRVVIQLLVAATSMLRLRLRLLRCKIPVREESSKLSKWTGIWNGRGLLIDHWKGHLSGLRLWELFPCDERMAK